MSLAQPLPPSRPTPRRSYRGAPVAAEQAVRAPELTVVPTRLASRSQAAFLIVLMLALVAALAGSLVLNTLMAQGSYEQAALQKQISQEASQTDILQTRLDDLNTPKNLARSAKRLGMKQQQAPLMIRLSDSSIVGLAK
ncbi:hypothetical protein [Rarobacter incanus]|uniref:Cell division protein FtsL n=1 Tax=Rarobacter incanus TaxID=153494 RepID=A0A542SLI0_9MICO|nr:hypothetical protein [Rarobacter incanus]TQK75490.1 hypothetical protein FB389_0117 [Rarobacter incanus]